jgi:hypothetical protein
MDDRHVRRRNKVTALATNARQAQAVFAR